MSLIVVAGCDVSARRSRVPLCEGCNVVVISMDTLRADHVGAYGYAKPTTPNVDRLAARGVVFENAISQSAWTRPAHASMFTGLYPSEHGIVDVSRAAVLSAEVPTLAKSLRASGYRTAAFTGGGNMSAHFGFDAGFEVYRSPGRRLQESLPQIDAWLKHYGREPLFLFVHSFDAHRPYKSRAEDRRALGLTKSPPSLRMQRACRDARRPADLAPYVDEYDAAVHHGDRGVGRLLDLLRRHGLADRTVVVFTSDHGEEFFEHGNCFHVRTLYREILHVPLIIAVPGLEPRRIMGPVPASVSMYSTILDVVGVSRVKRTGPSLAGLLEGRKRGEFGYVSSETAMRYRNHAYGSVRSLTGSTERLIYWSAEDRFEYFDLANDPWERAPIHNSQRARALLRHLDLWLAAHPPRQGTTVARAVPRPLARELRLLGYVD